MICREGRRGLRRLPSFDLRCKVELIIARVEMEKLGALSGGQGRICADEVVGHDIVRSFARSTLEDSPLRLADLLTGRDPTRMRGG